MPNETYFANGDAVIIDLAAARMTGQIEKPPIP